MYPVSAAYKTAIQQNVRDIKITGTITLKDDTVINITDEDIVQGSLYVTEQCVAGEDIEVGNVYASEMGLSLSTPMANPYSLDGARILLHFGLDVGGGVWETVPLGYFYVTEIQRKANNVNLTALDGMLLFDIPVGEPGSSSPRNFIVHACQRAGVTLGTSIGEIDTFANSGVLLAAPDASKIKTCRDLLMWACQIMGAFARMNRSGELEIVPIKARPSVKTINKSERFSSDVSDFAIQITKVSMQIGETEYSRGTEGMTMVLDENPLMAGLSETQINQMLDYFLAQITTAVYVPFNSNFIGDPALQPGDFVTLSDTSVLGSGDVASIITHSTWRYRGPHNLKAAGKHGLVRGVQNQQMKAVSSIVAIARAAQDLALAANQSTQLIKDAIGGHVLIRQAPDETNEILIMDHPDPAQATKIWRWNMGGLGYSDNCVGADNPAREYDIAMTMDGAINANFIKTGQLDAGLITVGPESTFAPGYDPVDNHLFFQYSVDGITSWHDTFNAEVDKYMRQKVGDNGTWSDPMRVVGEDGKDGVDGYTPIKGVDYFDGVDGQDGQPGADGKDGTSAYLWVRYSQNANGNPMTTDPTGAKYIGVATTTTASAPSSYASYSWSLIKGTDGIPGEAGEDGQTSYLHIKYSDDGTTFTGNGGEDVGAYIGTYVDFTQADSTNFGDYTWNKVKGEDGRDGYTPIKGVDYFDGVDGQPGADGIDGTSAYLWIRYSQNSNGNPMTTDPTNAVYIGIATTTTPSAPTSYTAYSWSLIKGQDGIPGETGADGQTSYLHIKYSDDGVNFTANNGEDVGAWIGTYVDFNPVDSMNFNDYTWNKVRGEDGYTPVKGTDYFDGVDGQDGTSSYLWVRYSQNSNGDPMTTDPTGAIYIGIATTTTASAPTSYTSYSWSLIKGQDGVAGETGADGRTSYLHIKYSDDGETFTPTWDWETEIENVTYSYVQSLHGTSWAAQGFKPTENLVGATTIRASLKSNGYNGVPPDTYWHVYTDNNGVPGVSISQNGFGTVLGVDWASSYSWSTAEIKLSEPLQEGQQYWLVVMSEDGDSSNRVKALYSVSDVYPDGYRCTSSNKGASWSKFLNRDLTFKIEGYNIVSYDGETPGKYIGTYVDFNPVDSTIFNDYTWNKVKGTPIVWKGELASPPSNPEENWVYRNINNGYVYIYNGSFWELMVTDGADGIDGAPGADGMSVYITYHNNPTDSQPATPTGDGTSGGWYTAPSAQANWMSQKVATNAYSGTWGAPILISGGRKFTSQPVPPYDVGDLWIGGSDGQNTLICTTARSSGSFVASDWERMTEPVANMGVDADCTGLWHFDGSLNSHKGLTPTFTRASGAYLSDGTKVEAGQPRFEDGKFGQAVMVEERTENLLTNPFFSSGLSGWSIQNVTGDNEIYVTDGVAVIKAVDARPGLCQGVNLDVGTIITVSVLIKRTSGSIAPRLRWGVGPVIREIEISENGQWVKCSAITDVQGNGNIIIEPSIAGQAEYEIKAVQVEQKPYPTSFIDGTRAKETLTIPTDGVLNPQEGTWGLWVYIDSTARRQVADQWPVIFRIPRVSGGIGIVLYHDNDTATWKLQTQNDAGTRSEAVCSDSCTPDGWHHFAVAWKSGEIALLIDGVRRITITNPNMPSGFAANAYIGSDASYFLNTAFDELRIDKVCRTDEEIAGWYKANAPFYTSEDMKQWPGYVKVETDGLKVYDSSDALRVLVGSWVEDAIRKYGIRIIDGLIEASKIYGTSFQSGGKSATSYVRIGAGFEPLEIKENGKTALNIWAHDGGMLQFYDTRLDDMVGQIAPMNDAKGQGLRIDARNSPSYARDLNIIGKWVTIDSSDQFYVDADGTILLRSPYQIDLSGDTHVSGDLTKTGTLNYVEPTKDYGIRLLNALEGPELKYVDMGRAQLENGEATVYLDPILLQCIEPDTDLTPWLFKTEVYGEGEDIRVIEWGENYFKVKECNGGTSNRKFGWWFYATRINYAGIRLQEYVAGVV